MPSVLRRLILREAHPAAEEPDARRVYERLCEARRARQASLESEVAALIFSKVRLEALVFERRAEIARLHADGLVAKRAGHHRMCAEFEAHKESERSRLAELEGELSETRREVAEAKHVLMEQRRALRSLDTERIRSLGQLRRADVRKRVEALLRESTAEVDALEAARTQTQRQIAEAELDREIRALGGTG